MSNWKAGVIVVGTAAWLVAGSAQATVIWQDEMGTLATWTESSGIAGVEPGDGVGGLRTVDLGGDPAPDAVQFNSWWDDGAGTLAGWTQFWTDSGVVIEDNTDYTLTVNLASFAAATAVKLDLANVTDAWAVIATDSPIPATSVFADYTVSFSTKSGANAGAVGDVLGVAISPDWWNNGQVDHVSISAIPEPISLVLLGLGGVVAFVTRRR